MLNVRVRLWLIALMFFLVHIGVTVLQEFSGQTQRHPVMSHVQYVNPSSSSPSSLSSLSSSSSSSHLYVFSHFWEALASLLSLSRWPEVRSRLCTGSLCAPPSSFLPSSVSFSSPSSLHPGRLGDSLWSAADLLPPPLSAEWWNFSLPQPSACCPPLITSLCVCVCGCGKPRKRLKWWIWGCLSSLVEGKFFQNCKFSEEFN